LSANEIQIPYDKRHEVSSLVKSHQNTHNGRIRREGCAIHMEGLKIRERILGTDNAERCYPIRYHGAVFADSEIYEVCLGLWEHAMDIYQRCNVSAAEDLEMMAS